MEGAILPQTVQNKIKKPHLSAIHKYQKLQSKEKQKEIRRSNDQQNYKELQESTTKKNTNSRGQVVTNDLKFASYQPAISWQPYVEKSNSKSIS